VPTPDFITALREKVGTARLWLSGATAVVLRDGEAGEEVLLVRRSDTGEWTPVAGIIDPGEQPHAAAVREVAEEAGVSAEVDRLVWLTVTEVITYANGDETQYIDHVFRCRWTGGEPFPADGEASEARFFPAGALPPMSLRHAEQVRVALADEPEARLG
jgi:8-oxo-dGTP pyrophosphatase MutT (NUDIX family)